MTLIDSLRSPRQASVVSAGRPKLIAQVRAAMRLRHYSRRTEEVYLRWMRQFIQFHGTRHPAEMGRAEVSAFLTSLAVERGVSASTQNQALAALLFLYGEVLGHQVAWVADIVRAKRPGRIPVVLTRDEVRAVLGCMRSVPQLVARLLYGSGLRLLEALCLRVKDLDFSLNEIRVRGGKGDRDRVTMLSVSLKAVLGAHLDAVRGQHHRDFAAGAGWVALPGALAAKYPNAGREWGWQWVFPATKLYVDPATRQGRRHHLHETVLQRAFREAVRASGIVKPAHCHTCATRLRLICSRLGTTYGRFRSCWGTGTSALHACSQSWAFRCAEPSRRPMTAPHCGYLVKPGFVGFTNGLPYDGHI